MTLPAYLLAIAAATGWALAIHWHDESRHYRSELRIERSDHAATVEETYQCVTALTRLANREITNAVQIVRGNRMWQRWCTAENVCERGW